MCVTNVNIELLNGFASGPKKITLDGGHETVGYRLYREDVDKDMCGAFYKELHTPGVYVLIGERTKGTGKELYVGQSEDVAKRLYDHRGKRSGEKKQKTGKEFWDECIAFVTRKELEMTKADYLEVLFYEELCKVKAFAMNNNSKPDNRSANDDIRKECRDTVFADAKIITECIGLPLFMNETIIDEFDGIPLLEIEYIGKDEDNNPKRIYAKGHYHTTKDGVNGFMVHAGSVIATKCTKKASPSIIKRRAELEKYNIIGRNNNNETVFLNNRIFESAGIAASVVFGRSASENEWKETKNKK